MVLAAGHASSAAATSAPSACADPIADASAAAPAPAARSPPASGWDAAAALGCAPRNPLRPSCLIAAQYRVTGRPRDAIDRDTDRSSSNRQTHTPHRNCRRFSTTPLTFQGMPPSTRLRKRTKSVNHLPGLFCKLCARSIPSAYPGLTPWAKLIRPFEA